MEDKLAKKLVGTYCVCHNLLYKEVALFVQSSLNINSIEDLNKYMQCAKTCKLCVPDIQKILDFYRKQP